MEKRKQFRLLPPPNTYAALGRNYTTVGKVKDISLGGLALEYIAGEETDLSSDIVDIFLVGSVFYCYNIACQIEYDIQVYVPHVNNHFIKTLTTKRCGIRFKSLSEENRAQLNLLLESNMERTSI